MFKYSLLLVFILFALASCGPAGGAQEDGDNESVEPMASTPTLPTVEDQQSEVGNGSDYDSTNSRLTPLDPLTTEPAGELDATTGVMTPVAPGGVIDLSELDDEVVNDETTKELVEQPMPGAPDATERLIELTIQDLAGREGVDPKEIQLVDIKAIEWTDSGLGCPTPGANYLTIMVPGHRITLAYSGEQYVYHTDSRQQIVLCEEGNRVGP